MDRKLKQAFAHRRTYYSIGNQPVTSNEALEKLLVHVMDNIPSAFNSQSTRIVLLLDKEHIRFWKIVKDTLRGIVPQDAFPKTEYKIDTCFAAGYGTILFYEERKVVEDLQQQFPLYADHFPTFSQHTSAMHQLAVWTMLEDAGWGASLQHYNPLIDECVCKEWNLPETWQLVAQMPFGNPLSEPEAKTVIPASEKIRIFK